MILVPLDLDEGKHIMLRIDNLTVHEVNDVIRQHLMGTYNTQGVMAYPYPKDTVAGEPMLNHGEQEVRVLIPAYSFHNMGMATTLLMLTLMEDAKA